jgi:secreted PhoX family phosphatase
LGFQKLSKGDQNYLIGTGPAATQVFTKSADGLGAKIIGTAYNCSGGTTPWGEFYRLKKLPRQCTLFQGVTEPVKPDGTQTGYIAGTSGEKFGLVGEKYGWMVEIDPTDPNYRPRKHTALGRFAMKTLPCE